MRVLVAGGRQVDSGKTTFTRGLHAATGVAAYKPRAANDRWTHYEFYCRALEEGILYGKDARRLAADQDHTLTIETLNPIHRLWQPARDGDGLLDMPNQEFVLDRAGDSYIVNGTVELPEALTAALPLADAPRVTSLDELNRHVANRHAAALAGLCDHLARGDPAIVESYSDIASPLPETSIDLAAVVEPERVRLYAGDRYADACAAVPTRPREGVMEPVASRAIQELSPLASHPLPPLREATRSTPVEIARAYREPYETVVRLARDG